jgi:hypothetical protein
MQRPWGKLARLDRTEKKRLANPPITRLDGSAPGPTVSALSGLP